MPLEQLSLAQNNMIIKSDCCASDVSGAQCLNCGAYAFFIESDNKEAFEKSVYDWFMKNASKSTPEELAKFAMFVINEAWALKSV